MDSIVTVINNGLTQMPDLVDPRYGYHYTQDPTRATNIGTDGANNPGNFPNASKLIELNKDFIIEELIAYINATYPSLTYSEAKCRRDTGFIVD